MRSFAKRRILNSEMALQITSMADIFMILLVFLLKNYSTSLTNISPDAATKLPQASVQGNLRESLKVEISNEAILVDSSRVVGLKNFKLPGGESDGEGSVPLLQAVFERERAKGINTERQNTLLLMADQKAPYATIKRVVASAAGAGYLTLQLVVVREDE